MAMDLQSAIGKLVLFRFCQEITNDFGRFGVTGENMWAALAGVEPNIGVWIKNPKHELSIWWDDNGDTISEVSRKKENFETDILIPWRYIKGIMSVRDTRFEKEAVEQKTIGFHKSDE